MFNWIFKIDVIKSIFLKHRCIKINIFLKRKSQFRCLFIMDSEEIINRRQNETYLSTEIQNQSSSF